jgi:hypothetical protein
MSSLESLPDSSSSCSSSSSSSSSSPASNPSSFASSERIVDRFRASPGSREDGRQQDGITCAHRSTGRAGSSAAHAHRHALHIFVRIDQIEGDECSRRRRAPREDPAVLVGSFAFRLRRGFSGTYAPALKSESLSEASHGQGHDTAYGRERVAISPTGAAMACFRPFPESCVSVEPPFRGSCARYSYACVLACTAVADMR